MDMDKDNNETSIIEDFAPAILKKEFFKIIAKDGKNIKGECAGCLKIGKISLIKGQSNSTGNFLRH